MSAPCWRGGRVRWRCRWPPACRSRWWPPPCTYLPYLFTVKKCWLILSLRTCLVGEEVEGDGGADDLLHVGADDGHLRAPTYLPYLFTVKKCWLILSLCACLVGEEVEGDGGADDLLHVGADDGHLRAPAYLTFLLLKNADSFPLSVSRTCLVGEEVESDGGADDLLHVGADDGHLRAQPQRQARQCRILPAVQTIMSSKISWMKDIKYGTVNTVPGTGTHLHISIIRISWHNTLEKLILALNRFQ